MGYDLVGDGDLECWTETEDDADEKACVDIPCEPWPGEVERLVSATAPRPGFLPSVWNLFGRRGRE